jgi:hypothetical protein
MNHSKILAEFRILAKEYANQCYLVSEENYPEENEEKGLEKLETAFTSAYAEGKKDALKKVLDILPKEVIEIDDFSSWNAYRLAAREIIEKLIEE